MRSETTWATNSGVRRSSTNAGRSWASDARFGSGELAGQEVAFFLPLLLRELHVSRCTLVELAVHRAVESASDVEPKLLELACRARACTTPGESFHERLLELGSRTGMFDEVLGPAMAHQSLETALRRCELPVDDSLTSRLQEFAVQACPSNLILFLSRVTAQGAEWHVPMMDFRLAASHYNHVSARAIARKLGPGALVISGSSYHYYGRFLLDESHMSAWLLRAQLIGRFVDTRWITHQLIDECCALRVTANGRDYGFAPTVLDIVD